jgi:hypothetical protein
MQRVDISHVVLEAMIDNQFVTFERQQLHLAARKPEQSLLYDTLGNL